MIKSIKCIVKYRLSQASKQREFLLQSIGCNRLVYNYFLNQRCKIYELNKKNVNYYDNCNELIKLKKVKPFLFDVASQLLQITPSALDKTFKSFFISLYIEEMIEIKEKKSQSIERDIGIKDFLILLNGIKIAIPKIAKLFENRIIRKQRRLSRKINNSKNKEKQRILLAQISYKLNERLSNIKKDFLHKPSNQITNSGSLTISTSVSTNDVSTNDVGTNDVGTNDYDTICLEVLNIKVMIKNHNLAKSIQSLSIYKFVRQLAYKSEKKDGIVIQIDRFFPSSQICSNCKYQNKDMISINNLKVGEWICYNCCIHRDRDVNTSMNILNEGLKQDTQPSLLG